MRNTHYLAWHTTCVAFCIAQMTSCVYIGYERYSNGSIIRAQAGLYWIKEDLEDGKIEKNLYASSHSRSLFICIYVTRYVLVHVCVCAVHFQYGVTIDNLSNIPLSIDLYSMIVIENDALHIEACMTKSIQQNCNHHACVINVISHYLKIIHFMYILSRFSLVFLSLSHLQHTKWFEHSLEIAFINQIEIISMFKCVCVCVCTRHNGSGF